MGKNLTVALGISSRASKEWHEIIADSNDNVSQDGNWRYRVDSSGVLYTQKLISGTWTTAKTNQKS